MVIVKNCKFSHAEIGVSAGGTVHVDGLEMDNVDIGVHVREGGENSVFNNVSISHTKIAFLMDDQVGVKLNEEQSKELSEIAANSVNERDFSDKVARSAVGRWIANQKGIEWANWGAVIWKFLQSGQ